MALHSAEADSAGVRVLEEWCFLSTGIRGVVMILAWALMGHMVADHHTIRD